MDKEVVKSDARRRKSVVWVNAGGGGGVGRESWDWRSGVSQARDTRRWCRVRRWEVIWIESWGSAVGVGAGGGIVGSGEVLSWDGCVQEGVEWELWK